MTAWLMLFAGSVVAGAAVVGLMVTPRRLQMLASACIALGLLGLGQGFTALAASPAPPDALVIAAILAIASITGGYWVTASALVGIARRRRPLDGPRTRREPSGRRTAVVILSTAEPERYTFRGAALRLRRLLDTGALSLPSSALPFVFLSEKSRYRAIHEFNPARATAAIVASNIEAALVATNDAERVCLAWCDGSPTLAHRVSELAADGFTDVAVLILGNDGAFLMERAIRELEDARIEGVRTITAPSIWHSEALALRVRDRVIEATAGTDCEHVGVAVLGEGQPPEWEAASRDWREKETYFTQRVRLLLCERGIDERNVRAGWLEWQMPDVTEVVRHLAAMGCTKVVVVPATVPLATLTTALDMPAGLKSARLADSTQAVTLTPWGDDPVMTEVLVETVRIAFRELGR
ncbi:MAG: CbiX/SirB N-terminal domain-containing protein [Coriobacteriia bacterium]